MEAKIVIGSGFGDEGKGAAVDYLTRNFAKQKLVIRFNGGGQAGHTVVHGDIRHVFSNFGAGTLNGVPTYWSKYCTFCPASTLQEYKKLKEISPNVVLYVDNLCPVITPFDINANRYDTVMKANGTCGVGYGTTMKRHEETPYKLFAQDLLNMKITKEKVRAISHYYSTDKPFILDGWNHVNTDKFFDSLKELYKLRDSGNIIFVNEAEIFSKFSQFIFEGAQGILLDQEHGFFPNVTRSNTTSKNAIEILKRNNITNYSKYYISRAYQTRHGNGPMSNERYPVTLTNNDKETNINNAFQGAFRTGILDLDLLIHSIQIDLNYSENKNNNLVMTCLDQVSKFNIPVTYKDQKDILSIFDIFKILRSNFKDLRTIMSSNPYADWEVHTSEQNIVNI